MWGGIKTAFQVEHDIDWVSEFLYIMISERVHPFQVFSIKVQMVLFVSGIQVWIDYKLCFLTKFTVCVLDPCWSNIACKDCVCLAPLACVTTPMT